MRREEEYDDRDEEYEDGDEDEDEETHKAVHHFVYEHSVVSTGILGVDVGRMFRLSVFVWGGESSRNRFVCPLSKNEQREGGQLLGRPGVHAVDFERRRGRLGVGWHVLAVFARLLFVTLASYIVRTIELLP